MPYSTVKASNIFIEEMLKIKEHGLEITGVRFDRENETLLFTVYNKDLPEHTKEVKVLYTKDESGNITSSLEFVEDKNPPFDYRNEFYA